MPTARELHPSEQKYLETEFKGGDGAAPYVKLRSCGLPASA
jgi:hypothetical protein